MFRKALQGLAIAACVATVASPAIGLAEETPGVTATEIKIGNTAAYSGPASAYGIIARTEAAYFKMINDKGGIAGHKIVYDSLDDGYSPPKTVEQVRRLVEEDKVAYVFATIGTPSNTAIAKYLNSKGVPMLFIGSGAHKWGDYKQFPWTIGWQPSYRTEAQIYTRYVLKNKPDAKIGILYQNDDFGKDYPQGVKDVLGDRYDKMVKAVSYEVTDATINSQALELKNWGADVVITAATPKFAAQMIRTISDLNWKPLHFMTNVSISVGSVITPAGPERAVGMISAAYLKDPTDPTWKNDPGMNEWRAFMNSYMPGADLTDAGPVFAYGVTSTLLQVLKQAGNDFSRANVMRQAANLHNLEIPVLLPGITINTSPTDFHPIKQMQLQKWNGKSWELFGPIIGGAAS